MSGVVPIGNWQLALAACFMLAAGIASRRLRLGLTKDIAVATLRVFLQLIALGIVLGYVFQYQTPWLVGALLLVMLVSATIIARGRVKNGPSGLGPTLFISLFVTSATVTCAVVALVVRPDPLWDARTVLTLGGMVLGNSMSAAAVALDRLYADLDTRADEILSLTALGATPAEAAHASMASSIRSGMIPTLSTMCAAGLVTIPGMMSGQILAGADPLMAAKYQIVVLLMISAATTICNVLVVGLGYRKRFDKNGVFLEPGLRER
ncbi:MAG: iron export ABC transporter permease subunit FetB [Atopobiaceae bacterium]|jgi:putative ABC transport system permease protein|nr:iron export ABC transporter permease subunit FetB [Atopobiaceae bacterium]MCH4180026.1 iron export ABC transporter permease subunit FetB [Atopobiaceae bacterium]MCH4213922.1 iron export ABC transporter permease subunit FetB [Atopobiaceae bacterium]MCH4229828.1 iron export ABC transporter permease subunit FetB [Atopobiaceae bacterium]MCH4275615.1 iron export ABC transporter permease subunit FetB [Atopobiaceae bacterium]